MLQISDLQHSFVSAEGSLIYILSMWKKLFFLEIQVEYHIKVILISTSGGLSWVSGEYFWNKSLLLT